jgi:tRNA (guanine-N7-)-methyltransferase
LGSKNKLKRFEQNNTYSHVIQPGRDEILEGNFHLKGQWRNFFKNDNPIVLELGCGKGEYTTGLAKIDASRNFIGVDIKGARLWRGAKTALDENLKNVAFLRTQIELIDLIFAENEVDEIWITFPDPQIKYKRTKHRLTNKAFLDKYRFVLNDKGVVNLKTDSEFMHGYTLGILHGLGCKILYANHDIYRNEGSPNEVMDIRTFYENQYLEKGKPITYIKFTVN